MDASPSSEQSQVVMTIVQAKDLFSRYGEALRPDFDRMVDLFREQNITVPIDNSNYLHALSLIDQMFRHTKRSLKMLTGSLRTGVPECLHDSFETMLGRLRRNRGTAEIVAINDDEMCGLEALQSRFRDVLEVASWSLLGDSVHPHFIVCDSVMVRDELPHEPLQDDTDANQIKAKVYFANRIQAKFLTVTFDAIWTKLKRVEPAAS